MNIYEEFEDSVRWLENKDADFKRIHTSLIHAIVGIAEEAGELVGILKRAAVYKKYSGDKHLKEEAGDLLHYLQMLCNSQGWTIADLMRANIDKLKVRYPGGRFSYKDAHERKDKDGR